MANEFVAGYKGITAHLDQNERALLGKLFADIVDMLEPEDGPDADPLAALVGLSPDAQRPSDPALARLLPDALHEDEEASLDFRRLTERSLRESKIGYLRQAALLMESAQPLMNTEQAQALSMAVNDVRLVLAQRLGIVDEESAEKVHDQALAARDDVKDIDAQLALIYSFITWIQGSLMEAMMLQLQQAADAAGSADPTPGEADGENP